MPKNRFALLPKMFSYKLALEMDAVHFGHRLPFRIDRFTFHFQLNWIKIISRVRRPKRINHRQFYRFYLQTFFPAFWCLTIIILVNRLTVNASINEQSAEDKELSADESMLSYAPDWVSLTIIIFTKNFGYEIKFDAIFLSVSLGASELCV